MRKVKHIMHYAKSSKSGRVLLPLIALSVVLSFCLTAYRLPQSEMMSSVYTDEVIVAPGETLSSILSPRGMSGADIAEIADVLKKDADVRSIRAETDKLVLTCESEGAPVEKITYVPGPWRQIELWKENGAWECKILDVKPDVRVIYKSGKIEEGDSFYWAGTKAGIPENILAGVYDLLAFEMDFERDIRAGQEFYVVYEENYSNGEKIDNGRIVAISFDALRGDVQMYRFRKSNDTVGYYDEKGNGAIKSLKRTPINNARVTSSFNPNRKHPVLGYTRAHKGVDFRAGTGTPIPSAGAGTVVTKAYGKGYGNYVKIRHNGSYQTLYAHMSRFAKNIKVGSKVKQGQIIGYVGSTGYSTGPHLHYEIIKNGSHVNPMTVKLPAIDNLNKTDKDKFLDMTELLDSAIDAMEKNPNMFIPL